MPIRIRAACAGIVALVGAAHAENNLNTAYRAGSIAPPSGAEASAGDGTTFGINQGQASLRVPLVMPPGFTGVEPNLALQYDAGRRDGMLGAGWSIGLPSIRVKRSGTGGQPEYGSAVTWLGFGGEDLLPAGTLSDADADGITETIYRETRERSFVRYVELSGGGWRADYPDGRMLYLGLDPSARIVRAGLADHVAEWLPQRLVDPHGNTLEYTWVDAASISPYASSPTARYLSEIRYACDQCAQSSTYQSVQFGYVERASLGLGAYVDQSATFRVETELLLQTVTGHSRGLTPGQARTYTLTYDSVTQRPRVARVAVAAGGVSLPDQIITYTNPAAPPSIVSSLSNPPGANFGSGVQPMDLDKDGRVDVVDLSSLINPVWYRNLGGGAFGPSQIIVSPPGAAPTASDVSVEDQNRDLGMDIFDLGAELLFAHDGVVGWAAGEAATLPSISLSNDTVRIDVDLDGHVDLVDTSASWSGGHWTVYFNDGAGDFTTDVVDCLDAQGSNRPTPKLGSVLNASDPGVIFGDVNGDGLLDVLNVVGGTAYLYAGRGRGCFGAFAEDGATNAWELMSINALNNPTPGSLQLADMNADGLADIVEINAASNRVNILLQTAAGTFSEAGVGGPWNQTITAQAGCRIADYDHDGAAEVLCSDGWRLYDLANQPQGLLESVDNGRGLTRNLTYTTSASVAAAHEAAGTPWTRSIAASIPVVATVENDDNLGAIGTSTFDYRDGFYITDALEDRFEFVGFGYVATREQAWLDDGVNRGLDPQDPGSLSRNWYDVGEFDWTLRGLTACEEVWPGDAQPASFDCGGAVGALVRKAYEVSSDTHPVHGFATVQTDAIDEYILEGAPSGPRLRKTFTYDYWGNVTVSIDWGRFAVGAPNLGSDEHVIERDYIIDTDRWMLRRVARQREGGVDASSGPPTLAPLSVTFSLYDGNTDWANQTLTQGLTTERRLFEYDPITAIGSVATIETLTYTPHGLVETRTDANGFVLEKTYDAVQSLFLVDDLLDPTGLGLLTTQRWDSRIGRPTRITAPDGRLTRYGYDPLGRLTRVAAPGETLATASMTRTYVDAAPTSHWLERRSDGTPNGHLTMTIFDGRGSTRCKLAEAEGGLDVVAAQAVSGLGIPTLEWRPHRTSTVECPMPVITVGLQTSWSTPLDHMLVGVDALRRKTSIVEPDGKVLTTSYAPLAATYLDEEDTDPLSPHANTPIVHVFDGRGRLIRVDETHLAMDADPGTHSTHYRHDALDRLSEVEDDLGAIVYSVIYNSRGLPVQAVDADRGMTTTEYDAIGRVAKVTDARGEFMASTYDAAGRIETLTSDAGVSTFHYDIAVMPSGTSTCNTVGRLAWVEDPSGVTAYCYNRRGQVTRTDKIIDAHGPLALTTVRSYDALGREETLTHPDGSIWRSHYGVDSRLERLEAISGAASQDLVSDIDYAPTGQPTLIRLGNGMDLDFTYDIRSRLQTSVAGPEQDLTFIYDGVGNLRTVVDAAGDASAQFEYDDLYRLTEASGDRFGGEIAEYRYDRRGNMLSKTFTDNTDPVHIGALTYGDPVRVHAVTAAAGATFAYDDAGNLESDGQLTYGYTAAGMLASADDGAGATTQFTYDHANIRVHKAQGADTVTYVPAAGAELRTQGGVSRWVKTAMVAGRPVARVEDDFTAGTVRDHVFYFATDHLGSPTLVFDTNGDVIERAWTHPFGEENTAPLASAGTLSDYLVPADPDTHLNLRFQGREFDTETGFYDFGARIYRPDLGRFLTPDPVVPDPVGSQSWNRYAFVLNNPLRYVDPSGHGEEDADGAQTKEAQAKGDFVDAMVDEPLLRDTIRPALIDARGTAPDAISFDGGWTGDSQPWHHAKGLGEWPARWGVVTAGWFTDFAVGTGPEVRINWSLDNGFNRDLSNSWWVQDNVLSFYYKNKENIEAGRPLSETWKQGRSRFSVGEVLQAGLDPTEQFVGRFTVEAIYESSPGMMRIVVSNDTSFTSLAYHLNDDWHWDRDGPYMPFSTVRQYYVWEQPINPPSSLEPMTHNRPTHGEHSHE